MLYDVLWWSTMSIDRHELAATFSWASVIDQTSWLQTDHNQKVTEHTLLKVDNQKTSMNKLQNSVVLGRSINRLTLGIVC